MRFGTFDPRQREYVITDPRTPVKWINFIGTRSFGGFVDHTGGALLCKDDPTYNRITKYIHQLPASDFKGTTLYLRLRQPDGYRLFSPFFVPTLDPLDRFECHIGLGYTRIVSQAFGLLSDVTIFVPLGKTCELRLIRLTNRSAGSLEVDAIPVVEYTHPNALMQFTNADWVPQTMQSRVVRDGKHTLLIQYPFMLRDARINYLTSNRPASSFETNRRVFLGENEYGSFRRPLALLRPELGNTEAQRGDNVGALLIPLGCLAPGATCTLITQLGQAPDLASARASAERFQSTEAVEAELARIRVFWDGYLSALQVLTPDDDMNIMLNVHNPHQCYVTKTWSRYLSQYQTGLGARGIGIRDSSQDVMAVLPSVPQEGRELITALLSFQLRDGCAVHQFNPLTLQGSPGDAVEMADRPHYYSDDHLWTVLAVTAYLKETADFAFLEDVVPFYDRDKQGRPIESGTVRDHLQRALAFTRRDTGRHGLPLLGFADWNDTVNLPHGAESVFAAQLYGKALVETIALFDHIGDRVAADGYRSAHEEMRTRTEAVAWDGEWYVQYFDHRGEALGSDGNRYAQIHLNAQSWSVISGFAPPERGRQAMDSAYRRLNTRFGLKLSTPGFEGYDPSLGGVTTYPPGAKENGGIFLHPNAWAMIAEALLGNGDRAHQYYGQINPASKNDSIEVYECEPYVYAQNILGDEHPQFGLARNSWLTGTASWCYQAATQWILGIRPDYAGLRIDPCIPSAWGGFSAKRAFRGRTFWIRVHNPQHVCKGVAKMTVDGEVAPSNLIAPDLPGIEHSIEAWLGH